MDPSEPINWTFGPNLTGSSFAVKKFIAMTGSEGVVTMSFCVQLFPTCIIATCHPIEEVGLEECRNSEQVPYNTTTFPNYINRSLDDAARDLGGVLAMMKAGCHPYARRLVCSIIVPECLPGDDGLLAVPPCRDLCSSKNAII